MHPQILPADVAEDSLESLVSRHSRTGHGLYLAVLLMLLAGAALLPVVRVGVSVRGAGIVRPVTEKHEVRARVAGLAEVLAVREHQRVERGALLLELRPAAIRPRQALLDAQLRHTRGRVRDLELLAAMDGVAPPPLRLRTPGHRQELVRMLDELRGLTLREEQAGRELQRARALAGRGLLALSEVELAESRLAQLRAEGALLRQRYRGGWQAGLAAARLELQAQLARGAELEEEGELYRIRSPVAGTVEELAGVSPGSWVHAGERLAVISPSAELVAEVYVTPRDVGLLAVGTPARVLVDAFNHHDWGVLPGRVRQISDDYLLVDGRPMFRVEVAMGRTHLTLRTGRRGEVRKGMTLRAHFLVAERTLWQLLRDDVSDWLDPDGSG